MNSSTPEKVQTIANFAHIKADRITPLGQGATSAAWSVADADKSFIVRMVPIGVNRPVTYQSEFAILRLLHHQGCPVPQPVMSSVELVEPLAGVYEAWAITTTVPGYAVKKQTLLPEVAYDIGDFLSKLHSLSVTNFGRLKEQPSVLIGQQIEHRAGVCARWCWADLWPFDGSEIARHPLALLHPELLNRVQAYEPLLMQTLSAAPAVLTHSDLHGEHIFQHGSFLSGIIDFGAACISVPAWDFAVLAFYHGWPVVQLTLTAYASPFGRKHLLLQARLLAIVVALYKLSKATIAQATKAKIERIVQFLITTLAQIE